MAGWWLPDVVVVDVVVVVVIVVVLVVVTSTSYTLILMDQPEYRPHIWLESPGQSKLQSLSLLIWPLLLFPHRQVLLITPEKV